MKILVIDSETSACDLLVRTLKSYFPEHEWLEATSYEEGFAVAQKTTDLDLVFADLKTNEAGGPSLANLIEGMYPHVCIYYLGNHGVETTFFRARPGRVFSKPVNVREVVAAIQLAEQSLALTRGDGVRKTLSDSEGTHDLEKLNKMITGEGFTGQLAQFQLHEIIQLCCLGQRTGSMSVSKGAKSGAIYFYDGQIVHAVCDELEGEPAVEKIVSWRAGQFTIVDGIIAEKKTIQTDWNFLMLESMRKLDEQVAEGTTLIADVKVGNSLGPYHLSKEISKTEIEESYVANLHSTGLELDVCVLPPALNADSAKVKRFVAEATTKSDLDESAFLRVTKAVQTEGVYYYTVERVEGTTLNEFGSDNRQLSEPQALEILRTVGEAMAELRSMHPTHLPLTPRDIILDVKGGIRINNLASFRSGEDKSVRSQLRELAGAVQEAVGPAVVRSAELRNVLRRMEGTSLDKIQSWQGLRKAAEQAGRKMLESASDHSRSADENTSYVVNLVPDHSTIDVVKLGIAAAIAGLLVGSIFWATVRPDRANARDASGALMAAEPAGQTNTAEASLVRDPANLASPQFEPGAE